MGAAVGFGSDLWVRTCENLLLWAWVAYLAEMEQQTWLQQLHTCPILGGPQVAGYSQQLIRPWIQQLVWTELPFQHWTVAQVLVAW
jgi:hypothetical protein